MARLSDARNDEAARMRTTHLQALLRDSITPDFFDKNRYPAYILDKLNCGLLDAHGLLNDPNAFETLEKVHRCAAPSLPDAAHERDIVWRQGRDFSYTWDESYTLPENLYLLYSQGAGPQYRTMAQRFLMESFFDPLARGENNLGGLHDYSHANALCSAMQAYFVDGSEKHLQAALNGYRFILAQSYATGGFGADEIFEKPGSGKLLASLTNSHNNFETPCCAFAFLKLSRYLFQVTRDGLYGDAMERILWNTMFGALPLQPDGHTFYYADNNNQAQRVYSAHLWPCCSGTFTQVAADYGINTWQLGPENERSLWVNLYLPSTLRFKQDGTSVNVQQTGEYPQGEHVHLQVTAAKPVPFAIKLRIPAWCEGASVRVNGRLLRSHGKDGFVSLDRTWRTGDHVDLHLPAKLRLEPFPADGSTAQTNLVALCWGPWVLMPLAPSPTVGEGDLLKAERIGPTEWRVRRASSDLYLRPFFAVGGGTYSTYIQLA